MAKRKKIETEVTDDAEQSVAIENHQKPEPVLNRGSEGWVKVRAKAHLGEPDASGRVVHRVPGDVFEVKAARAPSLGNLVEPV